MDLSSENPDIVKKLTARYDKWLDEMAEPLQVPGKRWIPAQ
jgi:hypothetical protein